MANVRTIDMIWKMNLYYTTSIAFTSLSQKTKDKQCIFFNLIMEILIQLVLHAKQTAS